ncbi:MAG TPA: EamA family transporter [Chloroflexota bacterium]|nr:EamA family transporter [Chloroflexota bacterium]
MRVLLIPLLASLLSGVSAIFEKLSVVNLSPLTVLSLRYALMIPVLAAALVATGGHRELSTLDARTFLYIFIPALLALGSLTLYFTALRGDQVSRVFPLTELGPLIAFVLAAIFLGEPWSLQRLAGTVLIIAGIVLVR